MERAEQRSGWARRLECLRAELPHLESRTARVLSRLFMAASTGWLRVERPERLTALPQPAIYAFNHNNSIESVLVPNALIFLRRGRRIVFLIDWIFVRLPVIGWLLRLSRPVCVYTKPARWRLFESHRLARLGRSPVDAALERLEAGESVGIFPEGTRNRDARTLRRGRRGLGELVLRGAVPVVPVGIDFPAKERLGRIPAVGRMRVRIGEPLDFSRPALAPTVANPAEAAREIVDRVMVEIAGLCRKDYPHATHRRSEVAATAHPAPTTLAEIANPS